MKNFLKSKTNFRTLFLLILFLGAYFRFHNINWDQNQHLHPDERFLTMVTQAVKWPKSFSEYLNPQLSPLNPYNSNYDFFVYGTLPLKIVKYFSGVITFDNFAYNNITLVGRLISAFFDLGVVFLVFLIGKKVFNKKTGLIASFVYAISVLPIQLSHFYAVDAFLVFFLTLSFYFLILLVSNCHSGAKQSEARESRQNNNKALLHSGLLGISFGLALTCKISALLFLPIIGLGFLFLFSQRRKLSFFILNSSLLILTSYFTFRFADPRVFLNSNIFDPRLNSQFIDNLKQLSSFNDPSGFFPPAIQWIKTKPLLFPLKNLVLWGLGLPLGVVTAIAAFYSLFVLSGSITKLLKKHKLNFINHLTIQQFNHLTITLWIFLLFLYQGIQFVKAMRYFYPIYPFMAILAANFLLHCFKTLKQKYNDRLIILLFGLLAFVFLIWPVSFLSIYSRPHSRVTASEWIYQNIPAGSTISCEHWDDCLPLSLPNKNSSIYRYKTETLELYNSDSPQKWQKINGQLEKIDYIIMSSNRLWGSIPKVPEKYPLTSKFYKDLFAKKLQFTKVAEITSYPTIPILNIEIPDDSSDESFTVYDHPQVLIYAREK